jgi:radical SAM protein with 4Fe4S-binding SPASM domain
MEIKENGFHKFSRAKNITKEEFGDILPDLYWEYRDKWVRNPKKYIVSPAPLHLGVEVSTLCNLKCVFCARTKHLKDGTFRDVKNMSMNDFKIIVDQTAQNNVYGFCLNAMGEPLMNPEIVNMVDYAKRVGGYIDTMFHTNAMLLTPDISRGIIEAGLDQLIFSVDGSGKEEYERERIGARYYTIVENIKTFYEIRQRIGRRFPIIRLTMIVKPSTSKKSMHEFISQWTPIADIISFQELAEYGDDKKNVPEQKREICTQPWQRLAIDITGNILPCCEAVNYTNRMIFGNIHTDNILDVWLGNKMERLRSSLINKNYFSLCKNCSIMT